MSVSAINWALEQDIAETEKVVLLSLANALNEKTRRCDPPLPRLAHEARVSEKTIERRIKALRAADLVRTKRQRREPMTYVLACQPEFQDQTAGVGSKADQEQTNGELRSDKTAHQDQTPYTRAPDLEPEYNQKIEDIHKARAREPVEKRSSKRPLIPLPDGYEPDISKALEANYPLDEALHQVKRFKRRYRANGMLAADWDAKWEEWLENSLTRQNSLAASKRDPHRPPHQRHGGGNDESREATAFLEKIINGGGAAIALPAATPPRKHHDA